MAFNAGGWGVFPCIPTAPSIEFGLQTMYNPSVFGPPRCNFGGMEMAACGMQNPCLPPGKAMTLLQPPQALAQAHILQPATTDQSLELSLLRNNLLQQMAMLERNIILSQIPQKIESIPNLQIQSLLSGDLIQKFRNSELNKLTQFSTILSQSGAASPSSCHTVVSAAGATSSSRSSQSPSNPSSGSTPDRTASPNPGSPHSSYSSEERGAHRPTYKASESSSHHSDDLSTDGSPHDAKSRKRSWKILLTAELAAQIYGQRPQRGESTGPSSMDVASKCGVNSKTIRDIWNRETWVRATRSLWTPEEEEAYHDMLRSKGDDNAEGPAGPGDDSGQGGGLKRRGRPKGAKDSRPRKSRCAGEPTRPDTPPTAAAPAGSLAAANGTASHHNLSGGGLASPAAAPAPARDSALTLPPLGGVYGRPWL